MRRSPNPLPERRDEEEEEEEEEEEAAYGELSPPVRAGGYRVAGDVEVRAAELRQELIETRVAFAALERELWAARKAARKHAALAKAALVATRGGGGATLASLLALLLHGLDIVTSPPILPLLVIAGFVLGALFTPRQEGEDDSFPPAPPPRWF